MIPKSSSDPSSPGTAATKSKKGGDTGRGSASQLVDLSKLETTALRKYRRHFKLADVGPNSSKEQLLNAVGRHFMSQQLDELQVITGFMQAAKRLKS